jgi:anti-sigma B factor antagonist
MDVKMQAPQRRVMDFQIHQRDNEGIQVLDLQGSLIEGVAEGSLRAVVLALAEAGVVKVIFNFAGVSEIDADGAGAVVFCDACIARSGGALKLLNLSPRHLDLMILTKLDTISEVFTDEQDAINSFFPDREVNHYDVLEFVEEADKDPKGT